MVGYYRKFIPHFTDIMMPETNLTKKDVVFERTQHPNALLKVH